MSSLVVMLVCRLANCNIPQIPVAGNLNKEFTAASKINSSKSYYSVECYDSLVDAQNLICEIYRGEITSKF